ncbi:uncharacterized protein BKA78DRAFT_54419 [Phyllosticta capitalensis]|uniref:uncharacterized protein n=1 Tax=Phyllosticta capitalensis TaxID=121624 RepID=UPI0031327771
MTLVTYLTCVWLRQDKVRSVDSLELVDLVWGGERCRGSHFREVQGRRLTPFGPRRVRATRPLAEPHSVRPSVRLTCTKSSSINFCCVCLLPSARLPRQKPLSRVLVARAREREETCAFAPQPRFGTSGKYTRQPSSGDGGRCRTWNLCGVPQGA